VPGADAGAAAPAPFGVYVHIPFCASKCDYCAFATWTDRAHLVDAYLAALTVEIEQAVSSGMPPAASVFVGGGTPSLVDPDRLREVIAAIPVHDGAELTVECNPDDVDEAMLATYRSAGVNRISVGVQSTSAHVLASLGRTHDRANVVRAVDAIRAVGMPTFNVDVIYGAAGETLADWTSTLHDVIGLGPPHVSAYGLTVEAGTPLATAPERHPDDDDQADKYELADELLAAAGLTNYEVSNWARPGHESVHNRLYWGQHDYRGFGCAAHSHEAGRRWWNVRTPDRYIDAVRAGVSTEAAAEVLDPERRRTEGLQLALRTRDGVPLGAFDEETFTALTGLVEPHPVVPDRVVLTRAGRLLANEVSIRMR
jgi:oxygen-independent coproporphyrinogen-3 oxidase